MNRRPVFLGALSVGTLLALYLSSARRFLARRHTLARCPYCGYQGCDGSLSQCTERWTW